jgi:hypothetical protein
MLPVVLNTGAIVTIWLLLVHLIQAHLPDGAVSNAIHFIYR